MILSKNEARKLNRDYTIDLRYIMNKDYCNKTEGKNTITNKIIKYMGISGVIWFVLVVIGSWGGMIHIGEINASYDKEMSIKDKIRIERLKSCQEAYKESGINKQFIYGQIPAVRCGAYMTLVYAFESEYGQSKKCVKDKNCYGMKGNGVEYPAGFIQFDTYDEGRDYFSYKYFQWHYKKKINVFVHDWSMTDRDHYIAFMKENYWDTYMELERLYLMN